MAKDSTILTYSNAFTSLSSLDGVVTFAQPLRFGIRPKSQAIRLLKVCIPSHMPNIYQLGNSFNNGLIRLTQNGGTSWTQIQLPDGVYTLNYIEAAINTAVSAWWADSSDPGVKIRGNLATNMAYCELDSTKLNIVGQLGIDFSQSRINEVLGYITTQTFVTDGLHAADSYAKVDWFGNNISVQISGFGALSNKNGLPSEEICSIPLSASVGNTYIYPLTGIPSPYIPLRTMIETLQSFEVKFFGSRPLATGGLSPIYVLEGEVEVQLELIWS